MLVLLDKQFYWTFWSFLTIQLFTITLAWTPCYIFSILLLISISFKYPPSVLLLICLSFVCKQFYWICWSFLDKQFYWTCWSFTANYYLGLFLVCNLFCLIRLVYTCCTMRVHQFDTTPIELRYLYADETLFLFDYLCMLPSSSKYFHTT